MTKEFNLEEMANKIVELGKQAQDNMSHIAKTFEELISMFDQDKGFDGNELKLGDIHFSSNYDSWNEAKGTKKPFYYQPSDVNADSFGGFTLEEAEQLRDFLTDRINYLKS